MKSLNLLILASTFAFQAVVAYSQPPALPHQGAPISGRDRIYTGDQTSNTVTVIDPSNYNVLGTISFGAIRLTNDFNPQYVESVNAHGLGFSRDGRYIVSLSTLSNTLSVIRTADNKILTQTYVDRGPHEAFFGPDNRTVWVGTRGVSTISLVDGLNGTLVSRIFTGRGPSKVLFSPNGTVAYVNHIFENVLTVIDVQSRTVMYNITGLADKFSSDMMITADGGSIWAAHKMTGQVSVIDLAARKVIAVLETGPETNHPNFVVIDGVTHGFVTVAALNSTRVYRQPTPDAVPVHVKDILQSGIQPHGIWPSADNTRIYVVNEHSDTVDVIDTSSLEIIHTMKVGQEGQALIYVSNAVPEGSNGTTKYLGRQGLDLRVENVLIPLTGGIGHSNETIETAPQALITVRQTAGLDMFQVIGRNLVLNGTYTVSAMQPHASMRTPLVTFNASTPSKTGCGTAPQVLAFMKFFDVYDLSTVELREGQ